MISNGRLAVTTKILTHPGHATCLDRDFFFETMDQTSHGVGQGLQYLQKSDGGFHEYR
jgi:hypothetical protein